MDDCLRCGKAVFTIDLVGMHAVREGLPVAWKRPKLTWNAISAYTKHNTEKDPRPIPKAKRERHALRETPSALNGAVLAFFLPAILRLFAWLSA